MKRVICSIAVILLSFILQTTVFQALSLAEVVPNLMVIVTVALGYMGGEKEGMFVGLFCGLLMDIYFGSVIGLYALFLMLIGFLNGFFNKLYYTEDLIIPLILISISDFLYNFLYYCSEFLLRGKLNFFFYLRRIIFPEMIYTVLVSVIVYKLLHALYRHIYSSAEREA